MNLLRFAFIASLSFLVACNSGEDFSEGTTVGGGLITQQPADPLDPDQEAVEIELVAAVQTPSGMRSARVTNIGYTCGDVDFYIPTAEPGQPGNSLGLPQHVARCPLSATSIRFFIGRRPIDSGRRFYLGKARIPLCTGRETADCGNSPGFYQFSLADLVEEPSRVANTELTASTRVAMLAVLDAYNAIDSGDETDDLLLEIPAEAHDVTSGQFDSLVPPAASGGLYDASAHGSYADFQAAFGAGGWDTWRSEIQTAVQNAIDNDGADYSPLPDWPAEADSQEGALLAGGRSRAGLYQMVHNSPGALEYAIAFPDVIQYRRLSLVLTYLVMPDGSMLGIGPMTATPVEPDGGDADDQPDSLDDANTVSDLAVLGGGAAVDVESFLNAPGGVVSIRSYFQYDTQPTDLEVSGRLIGPFMYDGLGVAQDDGSPDRVDYKEDYPIAEGDTDTFDLLATGNEASRGRISGVLLGDNTSLFELDDGIGIRSAKTAGVAASVDAGIASALPAFYKLTFWKACVSDSPQTTPFETTDCFPIPANETSVDGNGDTEYSNYPALLPGGASFPDGYEVTEEQRREFAASDNGEVHLQLLSDGRVVTDRDADCTAVDESTLIDGAEGDGQIQEYQVGFVTRTLENADTGSRSANLVIFLVGDADRGDAGVAGYIPQFGTLVQGRVDLGTEGSPNTDAPLYRLSDANFDAQVRAGWIDQFQAFQFQDAAFDPDKNFQEQEAILQREFITLSGGATEGIAQESDGAGACQDVP